MEITIELLYWILVGCALLVVVLQGVSIHKKNTMQQLMLEDNVAIKAMFDETRALVAEQVNEQINVSKNQASELQNAISISRERMEELREETKRQQQAVLANQETHFDTNSKNQARISDRIASSETELKGVLAVLQSLINELRSVTDTNLANIEDRQVGTAAQLAQSTNELKDGTSELQTLLSNLHSQTSESLSDMTQTQSDSIKFVMNKQNDEFLHTQKLLGQSHSNLKELLVTLRKQAEKTEFTQKQSGIAQLEQLTTQIQKLRADNLVSLTNELAKHHELTLDTDDFLKKLGDCKVTQIEDKHSGQVTQVYYENGFKRSSDTFSGSTLKYQMVFNDDGKPVKGSEFDTKGNLVFEYVYDDAGEISKRTETLYDQTGTKVDTSETAY